MKKLTFCLALCLLLLCGCRKTTYISREDQLAQRSTAASTTAQDSTTNQTANISENTETDGTTADVNTLPPSTDDSTNAADSVKSTDDKKETDGSNKPEDTKASETTKVTEKPNTVTTTDAADSTSTGTEETTDSTEPPETTEAPEEDPYDISNYGVGAIAYTTQAAMNAQRTAVGVGELELDSYLCAIASVRAYECSQYWSHNRLDGSYWSSVLGAYGYGYSTAAENLAQGGIGLDGATVVALWTGSEGHLSNMTNPDYTRVGIGSYNYNGMTYVACLFVG